MADSDFTKRMQSVEERLDKMTQENRELWGMVVDLAARHNALVDRLEESGAMETKPKIVSLN